MWPSWSGSVTGIPVFTEGKLREAPRMSPQQPRQSTHIIYQILKHWPGKTPQSKRWVRYSVHVVSTGLKIRVQHEMLLGCWAIHYIYRRRRQKNSVQGIIKASAQVSFTHDSYTLLEHTFSTPKGCINSPEHICTISLSTSLIRLPSIGRGTQHP